MVKTQGTNTKLRLVLFNMLLFDFRSYEVQYLHSTQLSTNAPNHPTVQGHLEF